MQYSRFFSAVSAKDVGIAGGKGASLGEMTQAGISVPPGFVILANAFERFLAETDLAQEVTSILSKVVHTEMHTVEQASKELHALITTAVMPEDIAQEIIEQHKKLGAEFVAVRSSATAEDGAAAAWAGQLDTYLNTTEKDVLENVKKCWASLFTPRAIFYRVEQGMKDSSISVAVVIQKMVQSDVSGVAFSVHPVTEDYNQLIIEAGFGLGEAIVSGQITPDSYVVQKSPRDIIDKNIATQERALVKTSNGSNDWTTLAVEHGGRQALSDKQILELTELVLKIEQHYGFPCDIEWAFEDGQFYITQSRPITTLSKKSHELLPPQTDWIKYLERKQPLFLFDSLIKPYGRLLREVSGFGFEYQLHFFENDTGIFYRSNKEMQRADEYFLELIRNNDLRLNEWAKKAYEFNAAADELIQTYSDTKGVLEKKDVQKIIECWESILLYSTVLPYRILSAINYAVEKGEDKSIFHDVLQLFEPLRATTKYPQLISKIFPNVFRFLAKNNKTRDESFMNCLLLDEVKAFLEGGALPPEAELKARKKGSVFWLDTQTYKTIIKTDKDIIAKIGIHSTQDTISELHGTIAEPGYVKGVVRIINGQSDIGEFNEGDIVVSINTNPSLMPVLIKCGGIITDEGGIMCHAAIIARELKKPCIIGTKIATKVLKDGDLVEVDANKGVVAVIERVQNV